MSLHTDGEHKVLSFRSVHGLHDVRHKYVIRRPSLRSCLKDIHKLLAGVMIKSHLVKHLCAAVEITAVVVKRLRSISKGFKRCRGAFHLIELRICLIRILARSEETHAHTGEHLELRIRRTRSDRRHFKVPAGILVKQFPQIRNRILGEPEPLHFRRVKEGLKLHDNDVRQLIR